MKNTIIKLLIVTASLGLFTSCGVDDTYKTPLQEACVDSGLTKTKEVADIYAIATNPTGSPIPNTPTYTADDIIEAYVISSDEGGNFYKSMYLQPLDGSRGFNVSVDDANLYIKKFQPGKKVFVKLKNLAYGNPTSFACGLIFGAPPTDIYAVDRIPSLDYKNYLIPSCDIVSEDAIVKHLNLSQATNSAYLNTLVEFDDVQFESEIGTYDPNRTDEYDSSVYITNGTNSLAIRTSRYANFAGYNTPTGKGKIRGVLTKYNSGYQLIIRTERDVNMPNPRVDFTVPLGGTDIQYNGAFTENFESYAVTSNGATFPKYVNDAFIGARYWDVKTFSGNKYIQMSSYSSGGDNKAYLAMPVDLTAANTLSFKSKDGYNNGETLKVYYSTNYVPGGNISAATLVDITSNFNISTGNTSGYATNFTNSGNYAIPATLTGNGFFIFEYSGTSTITTTMELDDITVN